MITSIAFPKMFSANRTATVSDHAAIYQNVELILLSKMQEFFGDPEYGIPLVTQLFKYNRMVVSGIIIDAIYSTILHYIPEVKISRSDIKVTRRKTNELHIYVRLRNTTSGKPEIIAVNFGQIKN